MTLTIEVSAELEHRLETEARNNGVGKNEFAKIILEEKLNVKPENHSNAYGKITETGLPVRDFSREHNWLAKHRDEYDGQYVALDGDTLLANSENGKEVAAKVKELGIKSAYIVLVEGSNRPPFISGGVW